MRAGWILLEIRHKQYEVNVDEVGADSIRPLNPAGRRRYAGAIEGIKTGRCGHRPLQKYKDCGEYSRIIPQSAALTAPFTREPMRLQNLSPPCKG